MKKIILFFAIFQIMVLLSISSVAQSPNRQAPDLPIDAATKTQIINDLTKELNESYIFEEVAKNMKLRLNKTCATKPTIQLRVQENLPRS